MSVGSAFYIHFRSYDSQGGFWSVSPKGPYNDYQKACGVAQRMKAKPHKYRGVRLVVRTEVEVPILVEVSHDAGK